MASLEEVKLMGDLAVGDKTAFRIIYERYKYRVQGIAFYYLQSTEDAIDIVQEVFKNLWVNRKSATHIGSIGNYLVRAGRNKAISKLRADNVRSRYSGTVKFQPATDESVDEPCDQELIDKIEIAFAKIHAGPSKEAFRMYYFEGIDYKEAAKRLGVTIPTTRTYVYRVTKEIKAFFNIK